MRELLLTLTARARASGLSDARWAAAAGVRKETLSRLRRRETGDFATVARLAQALGAEVVARAATATPTSDDGHFPARVGRDEEERLLQLVASGSVDPDTWRAAGPPFFMAGLAVALASARGFDRTRLLALAEALHPGVSQPESFALWLERSPVRPSRFIPAARGRLRHAA